MIYLWKIQLAESGPSLKAIQPQIAFASLDAATLSLPAGAYTTLRTYQRDKALPLVDHFNRLEDSSRLVGIPLTLDRESLRQALRIAIRTAALETDARLRLIVDLQHETGAIYLALEPLHVPPPEAYRHGVRVVTTCRQRQNPQAKLTAYILQTGDLRANLPPDVNEALLVSETGLILEGMSSNFFAWRAGNLCTAGDGILSGLTRQIVIAEALRANIPLDYTPVSLTEINQIQEAFITSASRGILPVCQIDDQMIASGRPGPQTNLLGEHFNARILRDLVDI